MTLDDSDTQLNEALAARKTPHIDDIEYKTGKLLGGRYEVISLLGRGGMGLVYRVKQIFLNREFALKIIDKRHLSDVALRRFQLEARTTFSLDHPNIVKIHDFGLLEDDTPFLVMELINGETLGDYLKKTGTLSVDDAIALFVQICFGLAHAHDCGVIHRDVKPGNIMLLKSLPFSTEGSVKILDFGIAKFTSLEGGEIQTLTRTGEIFGSPLYMSPEQCSGAPVDQRTDIYSLGCVLFEALTGAPPFIGENALMTMMKHQSEPATSLREAALGKQFPEAMESIVTAMLAKSPADRYDNLGKVALDLGAVKRGESLAKVRETPSSPIKQSDTKVTMTPATFWGTILAAILVSATVSWIIGSSITSQSGAGDSAPKAVESKAAKTPVEEITDEYKIQELSPEDLDNQLKNHSSPTAFTLKNVKISRQTLTTIAQYPWIRWLTFKACELDNSALEELDPLPLQRVNFSDSDFSDEGVAALAKRTHAITEFIVNRTILTEVGITNLASSPHLRYLSITAMPLTDENMRALCKVKTLEYLDLQNDKQISPRSFDQLADLKLKWLGLEKTNVDHQALLRIAKMTSLEYIVLKGTSATMDDALMFCRMPKMVSVRIKDCPNLTPVDIASLKSRYPRIEFF